MPPPKPRAARSAPTRPPLRPHPATPPQPVDPVWLLKALALSLLAALLCAWLTLCLLFYQGEWQLVLHPTRGIAQTPASAGLAFDSVRFDASETGQPRLTAWDIPAPVSRDPTPPAATPPTATAAPYAAYTILYLHDGSGSLSATIPALARLHQAGLNVFAIDYRGFGASDASLHPNQARMAQDTAAALDFLVNTRHLPLQRILPFGDGLGAALAVNLAHQHPELPAVILSNPNPDPTATALAAQPSRMIPVRLLFRDRFDIATPLATLATPKLLIAGGPDPAEPDPSALRAIETLFHHAASPSFSVTLPPTNDSAPYTTTLTRFLDQYLPAAASPVASH